MIHTLSILFHWNLQKPPNVHQETIENIRKPPIFHEETIENIRKPPIFHEETIENIRKPPIFHEETRENFRKTSENYRKPQKTSNFSPENYRKIENFRKPPVLHQNTIENFKKLLFCHQKIHRKHQKLPIFDQETIQNIRKPPIVHQKTSSFYIRKLRKPMSMAPDLPPRSASPLLRHAALRAAVDAAGKFQQQHGEAGGEDRCGTCLGGYHGNKLIIYIYIYNMYNIYIYNI